MTRKGRRFTLKAMEDLTLGKMVLARMAELGLDLEEASLVTGISARHLRRILTDEGFVPQETTQARLALLGLSRQNILRGAAASKYKAQEARLPSEPLTVG